MVATTACAGDERRTFPEAVCQEVADWSIYLTRRANEFTDASRDIFSAGRRRERYEQAFTEVIARTEELGETVTAADELERPDGELIKAELLRAVADARFELADDLHRARLLPDDAYEERAVTEGRLFSGIEKTSSIVLRALGDIGTDREVPSLLGSCGRPAVNTDLNIPD